MPMPETSEDVLAHWQQVRRQPGRECSPLLPLLRPSFWQQVQHLIGLGFPNKPVLSSHLRPCTAATCPREPDRCHFDPQSPTQQCEPLQVLSLEHTQKKLKVPSGKLVSHSHPKSTPHMPADTEPWEKSVQGRPGGEPVRRAGL